MSFNQFDNELKRLEKQRKILVKKHLSDIDILNYLLLGIAPYSRYARMGMKKALRHAIKLLKEEKKRHRYE